MVSFLNVFFPQCVFQKGYHIFIISATTSPFFPMLQIFQLLFWHIQQLACAPLNESFVLQTAGSVVCYRKYFYNNRKDL